VSDIDSNHARLLMGHNTADITERVYRRKPRIVKPPKVIIILTLSRRIIYHHLHLSLRHFLNQRYHLDSSNQLEIQYNLYI